MLINCCYFHENFQLNQKQPLDFFPVAFRAKCTHKWTKFVSGTLFPATVKTKCKQHFAYGKLINFIAQQIPLVFCLSFSIANIFRRLTNACAIERERMKWRVFVPLLFGKSQFRRTAHHQCRAHRSFNFVSLNDLLHQSFDKSYVILKRQPTDIEGPRMRYSHAISHCIFHSNIIHTSKRMKSRFRRCTKQSKERNNKRNDMKINRRENRSISLIWKSFRFFFFPSFFSASIVVKQKNMTKLQIFFLSI